jgi:hypothetical protein
LALLKKVIKYTLITLLVLFLILFGVIDFIVNKQLKESGVVIKAQVTAFRDKGYTSTNRYSQPMVEYCFAVNGKEYCSGGQVHDSATYQICKRHGTRGQVDVVYLPDDPETSCLKGTLYQDGPGLMEYVNILCGISLLVIGIYSIAKKIYNRKV